MQGRLGDTDTRRACAPWVTVNGWFARLDLSGASDAQQRVIQRVIDLLDELQPARLDPALQVVKPEQGETWVSFDTTRSRGWRSDSFLATAGSTFTE